MLELPLRGQKPLVPMAVVDAALSVTPWAASTARAWFTQASEGSVAIPERPNTKSFFS